MYFRWNSFDDLFSKRNSCPVQIFFLLQVTIVKSSSVSEPHPLFVECNTGDKNPCLPILCKRRKRILFDIRFRDRKTFPFLTVRNPQSGKTPFPSHTPSGKNLLFVPECLIAEKLQFDFASNRGINQNFLKSGILRCRQQPLTDFCALLPPLLRRNPVSLFLHPFTKFLFLIHIFLQDFPQIHLHSSCQYC